MLVKDGIKVMVARTRLGQPQIDTKFTNLKAIAKKQWIMDEREATLPYSSISPTNSLLNL